MTDINQKNAEILALDLDVETLQAALMIAARGERGRHGSF